MHNRQWFSRQSQYGLEIHVQAFEDKLRKKQFEECYDILVQHIPKYPAYWNRQYKRLCHLYKRGHRSNNHPSLPVYIAWESFWPGFNIEDNQILDFLKIARPDLSLKSTNDPMLGSAYLVVLSRLQRPSILPLYTYSLFGRKRSA